MSRRQLHVSRSARERYEVAEELFSSRGDAVFPSFAAARRLAQRMNERRRATGESTDGPAEAGELNAIGLLHEILHGVVRVEDGARTSRAFADAEDALRERLGAEAVEAALRAFAAAFPAPEVARGALPLPRYLDGDTDGTPTREALLEEIVLLELARENPALGAYRDLLEEPALGASPEYPLVVRELRDQLEGGSSPEGEGLWTLLSAPARAAPDSLAAQLRYVRERWGARLGRVADRLTLGLDVLAEESRARWLRFEGGAGGPGSVAEAPNAGFAGLEDEAVRFSADLDWMPSVVLIAKSAYVWLDQLARAHGRPIWRLDQIPDEELDRLAGAGITGLWLIGLWERSQASQRIKQLRGNPEAVASAYSLRDYRIAEDLGGEEAYQDLRDRAAARGLRLASDMVPNHMGIDSRWVVEHPDWFLSRPDAPYPSYTFGGANLSSDERVGIYLEDHYWDGSDAAVVFQRVDRWSGETRYVYHGNDGTSTPWNDTAQLDYLRPDVREALIRTILHVARQFPIIRFDAAMTLAKRHIQRLWYPEPGSGGGIPSRAESSMTKAAFDAAMPVEFWREVVDRVAAEAPDTLLLAEAFWLMEGYFVRTLGMHRVYNSAFMHMLRDEQNAEYRDVIRTTLAFDPEILKRYVNFMNNPDERTAIDQFGSGDKYFGLCTLLVTLPGLPMLGHGQIEGFSEKYGMEFRRATLDERPDPALVARHEREIFPLLRRRRLFAEAREFRLYDLVRDDGTVDEAVFAYSNRSGDERALVVYHNRYAETSGWIRDGAPPGTSIAEGLGLTDTDAWLVLREERTGMEFLRPVPEVRERGLRLVLDAYRCQVFMGLRTIGGDDGRPWAELERRLGGSGVANVDGALLAMLAPAPDSSGQARGREDQHEGGRSMEMPGYALAVRLRARAGEEERVLQGLVRLAEASNAEPACRLWRAHRSPDDPRDFFLYELYDDAAALDAHRATEHFARYTEEIVPLLELREGTPYLPI